MENEIQNAVDALDNPAYTETSDIDVILNGEVVSEGKGFTPKTFAPHFAAALLAHALGHSVELIVHNPVVFDMMTANGRDAQPHERFNITLKAAA
ncbi:hypothetical protein Ga0061061_11722 [Chelatococcus sambhunathii]|uniref:Uncharacterized protein n=1 Tax=Chelatococcus sambhunathii TaxID=363953 RepID=A0ABP2ABV8_9HYPH|nr:hypothetical protein [Chelatococcus sambhunathii]CUA90967.1 hypothetical protein Ga0061061_11722 [Chelatococcus sambhunathii]